MATIESVIVATASLRAHKVPHYAEHHTDGSRRHVRGGARSPHERFKNPTCGEEQAQDA